MQNLYLAQILTIVLVAYWTIHAAECIKPLNLKSILSPIIGENKDMRRSFDEIDAYLSEKVKSDNLNENMFLVSEWIKNLKEDSIRRRDAKMPPIYEALLLFEALSDKNGNDLCTMSSYDTLKENSRAAGSILKRIKQGEKPRRRVESIIYQYAVKHDRECEFHYMHELEVNLPRMSRLNYDRVTKFIGDMITLQVDKPNHLQYFNLTDASRFLEDKPIEASRFAEYLKLTGKDPLEAEIVDHWLSEFVISANDTLEKYLDKVKRSGQRPDYDSPKLHHLFKEYLVHPCKEYTSKVGGAFNHNLALLSFTEPDTKDENVLDFYKHMAYFYGCKRFLDEQFTIYRNMLRWKSKSSAYYFIENAK